MEWTVSARPGFDRRDLLRGVAALGLALTLPARGAFAQSEPFRIGALTPITGAGSPYGTGMQKAILFAAAEVNDAGGAGGRTLEVIVDNDQTSPQHAVLVAKKLIEVDKAQAILGIWASSVTLAVMKLTDAAELIAMTTSGAPEISTIDKKDLVWRFQATNDRFGRAFAAVAQKRGFTRPATMAVNNPSGLGSANGFKTAWEATGGTLVAAVAYEPYRPSYRAELQSVLAAKPDVIVLGSYLPDATTILHEWHQGGGGGPTWIIPGWAANAELVKALGPDVTEGVISIDLAPNAAAASFASFAAKYKTATGKDGASNIYAAMCYDMVIALALAIEAAGPGASVKAINAKLREIANPPGTKVFSFAEGKAALKAGKIDYDGASSRLDFDQYGDITPTFGVNVITKGALKLAEVVAL
jgi:branched-chain amino acid transport system substrate-binding protein